MKVVLYNPRAVFHTMPLAILAVASACDRRRHQVVIVDGRLERDPAGRVVAEARDAGCLGVTVLTGAPIRDALAVCRAVKAARPDLPVVWGGWHPSLFPVECLDERSIDAVVIGQGEATFDELVARLASGAGLADCAGTASRRPDGRREMAAPRPLIDLNRLPRHEYGLIDVERYFASKRRRQLDYVSSQGCRFRCGFCADPSVYGRAWTGLEPRRVVEELAWLEARYGVADVAFQDETFFTSARRVEAICEGFLSRNLRFTWTATLRADQGCRLDEAVFAKAVQSGLRRVMVGVESGSQRMLDWMRKDQTVEQVLATAERCARHGVGAVFNFIVGFPGEPTEGFEATLALVKRLRAMHPAFETPVFAYRPYPGSDLGELAHATGYEFPRDLEGWAEFDYVGGRSPWLSDAQQRRVERLSFYARQAASPSGWRWPLRAVARWRCARDWYAFPIEKRLVEWLRPRERLA